MIDGFSRSRLICGNAWENDISRRFVVRALEPNPELEPDNAYEEEFTAKGGWRDVVACGGREEDLVSRRDNRDDICPDIEGVGGDDGTAVFSGGGGGSGGPEVESAASS